MRLLCGKRADLAFLRGDASKKSEDGNGNRKFENTVYDSEGGTAPPCCTTFALTVASFDAEITFLHLLVKRGRSEISFLEFSPS